MNMTCEDFTFIFLSLFYLAVIHNSFENHRLIKKMEAKITKIIMEVKNEKNN